MYLIVMFARGWEAHPILKPLLLGPNQHPVPHLAFIHPQLAFIHHKQLLWSQRLIYSHFTVMKIKMLKIMPPKKMFDRKSELSGEVKETLKELILLD